MADRRMTLERYLRILEKKLSFCSDAMREEVLESVRNSVMEGVRGGRTLSEMLRETGSPDEIADALRWMVPQERKPLRSRIPSRGGIMQEIDGAEECTKLYIRAVQSDLGVFIEPGGRLAFRCGTKRSLFFRSRGSLSVEIVKERVSLIYEKGSADLTVLIPPSIREIEIVHNVGPTEICLPGRQPENLKIRGSAGDVHLEEVSVKNAELVSDAGSIEARGCSFGGTLKAASGRIRLRGQRGTELSAETKSGDIIIDGEFGWLNADTSAGEIRIETSDICERIHAVSRTGSVTCTMHGGQYTAILLNGSGSVSNRTGQPYEQPGRHETIVGTGPCRITLRSASGDITLKEA